jgi:hypothetical protein
MLDITAKLVIIANRAAQNLQPVTFLIIASVLDNTEILTSRFRKENRQHWLSPTGMRFETSVGKSVDPAITRRSEERLTGQVSVRSQRTHRGSIKCAFDY